MASPWSRSARFASAPNRPRSSNPSRLKLYLGSFAQERMDTRRGTRAADHRRICRSAAQRRWMFRSCLRLTAMRIAELPGESIDDRNVAVDAYAPDRAAARAWHRLSSRNRCARRCSDPTVPVTGQPDYADVLVRYRGPRIDRTALLKYFVSYRQHAASTKPASSECSSTSACAADRNSSRCTRASCAAAASTSIRFGSNFEPAPRRNERTPRQ